MVWFCYDTKATDKEPAVLRVIFEFLADDSGATAVEYGLIAALVAVAAGGVISVLGQIVELVYNFVLSGVLSAAS
jgi:pilus assembly protein Flp/PilA